MINATVNKGDITLETKGAVEDIVCELATLSGAIAKEISGRTNVTERELLNVIGLTIIESGKFLDGIIKKEAPARKKLNGRNHTI